MIKIKVKKLDHESFRPYGDYVELIRPDEFYGDAPVMFTPDMLQLPVSQHDLSSYSVCRAVPREMIVTASEYHSSAWEANIPLEGDIVVHVAPANRGQIEPEKFEAFLIPKGTVVTFKPGVWHFAPYPVDRPVSTVVVLPERTYKNDCVVVRHAEDQILELEL